MLKNPLSIVLLLLISACSSKDTLTFGDFIDIAQIEKVEMMNNSGHFVLNDEQLQSFKKDIASLSYEPNITAKVGAIVMMVTIDEKTYELVTATHGDYLEINPDLVSKLKSKFKNNFFRTNGINFDNYKKVK